MSKSLTYQASSSLFSAVLEIFFREIITRGSHVIPQTGPVIFVCAPHANQFIDPILLIKSCGRQVGFLAAKKSMDKFWIGLFARSVGSIPVIRPQDLTKLGAGKVFATPEDLSLVYGVGTTFTKQIKARCQIAIAGEVLEVVEVISDTQLRVKTPFTVPAAITALTSKDDTGLNYATSAYKITPHVDQGDMFAAVIERLNEGGCIGIFPEGGSHDRTDFLPLKPGVALMALSAMAQNEKLDVKIVPCGLNYFHAHKFRSRAMIEFGDPLSVSKELVEKFKAGGSDKRAATGELLEKIYKSLKALTITSPDYESLMVIQAARRLYKPVHQKLSVEQTIELTKRFAEGFAMYHSDPRVQDLIVRVKAYNKLLKSFRIKDHQVVKTNIGGIQAIVRLVARVIEALGLLALATPGIILHWPILYLSRVISKQKAAEALAGSTVKLQGKDVMATWKVLVALVVTPILYLTYYMTFYLYLYMFTSYSNRYRWILTGLFAAICPAFGFAAVKASETGMDIIRSLRPLFLAMFPSWTSHLRKMRAELTISINALIADLGPQLYGVSKEEFEAKRIVKPDAAAYGEVLLTKKNADKTFRWEEVDADEPSDDVFLFRDTHSGATVGNRAAYGSPTRSEAPPNPLK
ncbi:hypothetical protein HDV05_007683 [Chytridiales sp. JEL 0842]|nr:hypothetical protein HDV05_007683 [Chytridiales sp. JEL 0842]